MPGPSGEEIKAVVEKCKESCITGDIELDVYSQRVFPGFTLENQGAIIQPYADLSFRHYQGEGALNSASLNLGLWNYSHPNPTVASPARAWYEFDFLAGTAGATYFNYGDPNKDDKTNDFVFNGGLKIDF